MRQFLSHKSKSRSARVWLQDSQDTGGAPTLKPEAAPSNISKDQMFLNRSSPHDPSKLGVFTTVNGPLSELDNNVGGKDQNLRFNYGDRSPSSSPRSTGENDIDEQRTISGVSQYDANVPEGHTPNHNNMPLRSANGIRKVTSRTPLAADPKVGPRLVVANTNSGRMDYQKCEDEPIHTPGAVQNFGALLGLKYNRQGHLEVRIASENSRKIIGYGPEQLLELESFLDILNPGFHDEMTARVNHCLLDVRAAKEETRLDVFQVTITFPYEPDLHLWCAVHLAPAPENLVICEFEEFSDSSHLSDLDSAKKLPPTPFQLMEADVSAEDFAKSTTRTSQPLPVLQIARQRDNKEFSSLDVVNAMSQCEKQIGRCKSLEQLYEVTVGLIAELTGYHRVMFYRFDDEKNGCVEAEILDSRASTDLYRGLHFPASDIPVQARKLYILNRIRLLHDRDAKTARLVCRSQADSAIPLDLSHAYLRAISPFHITYLKNLGVRSTMSISLVIDSDLWGMLACHGYGNAGVRISLPIRELCRNVAECAAVHIQRLLFQQRIEARRTLSTSLSTKVATSFTEDKSADLLKLLDADFALLSVGDRQRAIGSQDHQREAKAIVMHLRKANYTTIRCSQNIGADLPGIPLHPGTNVITGLLFVPFNAGEGKSFLVFFRKSQSSNVTWAGNPNDRRYRADSDCLDPRKSFARWTETVANTSRKWTEDQLDTAVILSTMYDTFIDLWPQKDALVNDRLPLIHALSERMRPSLDAIYDCLETALQHDVEDETRNVLIEAEELLTSVMPVVGNLFKITDSEDRPGSALLSGSPRMPGNEKARIVPRSRFMSPGSSKAPSVHTSYAVQSSHGSVFGGDDSQTLKESRRDDFTI